MLMLAIWLSGIGFALSLLALILAVAEHRRAMRAEQAIQASIENHKLTFDELFAGIGNVSASNANAWKLLAEHEQQLKRIAAGVVPTVAAIDPNKVHVLCAEPERRQ